MKTKIVEVKDLTIIIESKNNGFIARFAEYPLSSFFQPTPEKAVTNLKNLLAELTQKNPNECTLIKIDLDKKKPQFNSQIFMGSKQYTTAQMQFLHERLDYAFNCLSGLQQSRDEEEEINKQAYQDIIDVISDITIALGIKEHFFLENKDDINQISSEAMVEYLISLGYYIGTMKDLNNFQEFAIPRLEKRWDKLSESEKDWLNQLNPENCTHWYTKVHGDI